MTNGKFLLVLGLNALVSLAITLGVSDFMLNQRDKVEIQETPTQHKDKWEEAKKAAMEMEQRHRQQGEYADEQFSRFTGVTVIDVLRSGDTNQAKIMVEEGKIFCQNSGSVLFKIKFYGNVEEVPPSMWCANGVFK
ncbi:hypothetical protein HOV60_gp037 [Escherichia phage vB_Eco_mar003J3]|uniref:Uncharacterized protein n=2 Tax=Epseptimavirus TaxID=2732017 RepID=A0A385INS5_9CAUD|nr:hypothetical protein HOU17_gp031 [Salmonella phage Sw2]YP_009824420.1 hypothetical protein HOV60_gp037 [Escherichia phage vB_Eco_mar003J3]AXY84962.1 hypothetical protein CPT_Sw2_031 [Salmonella phage Sw2]VCU43856.1 hypothetical protein MAR003J3_00134 [Escherichia phage vB_Eco_mar003J3]